MKNFTLLLLAFLLTGTLLKAETVCSATAGNWTDDTNHSFDCTDISNADVLIIPAGVSVTINSSVSHDNDDLEIRVFGTLSFEGSSSKLSLGEDALVRIEIGGKLTTDQNNNSQKLKFGNSALWDSGDGDIDGFTYYSNNPLSVEMASLEVWKDHKEIVIDWTTMSEMNSDYFVVQRSNDAQNFETIGIVEANGSGTELRVYSFRDGSPLYGDNYYRIQEVDFNGNKQNSVVKSVWLQGEGDQQIWQNQTGSRIFIIKHRSITSSNLDIYTLGGKIIKRIDLDNRSNDVQLDMAFLDSGQYLLLLNNDRGETHSELLVRMNFR